MHFTTLILDTDARGIATLTLNRPDKHNAMNAEMIRELTEAAAMLAASDARAVILAGAGKSFCAGGDLNWMQSQAKQDRAGKIAEARALATMLSALNDLPQPLIARVHGPAYGGGVGLMAVSDIVIASDVAKFALTETRLGLIPATIGPFVVRRMGEGFARQVFFTAKSFGAKLALASGLVADVVQMENLDDRIEDEISAIMTTAPGAVTAAKSLAKRLGGPDLRDQIDMTVNALADRWESDEAKAGIDAFFARRPAPWVR